jgi:hypothetical protein
MNSRRAAVVQNATAELLNLTEAPRYRNGRLEIDWFSRRQLARWRMMPLDGQWYDRGRLRDWLRRRAQDRQGRVQTRASTYDVVPASRRRLTPAEARDAQDTNPWRLYKNA